MDAVTIVLLLAAYLITFFVILHELVKQREYGSVSKKKATVYVLGAIFSPIWLAAGVILLPVVFVVAVILYAIGLIIETFEIFRGK